MARPKGTKNKKITREILEQGEPCKITIKCLGRVFKSEGITFDDAVNKIKISNGARALSVITITDGKTKKTKILNARHTNGLFGQGSPTMKSIHIKSVKQMLGI